jgi:hypothetical protein
MVWKPFSRWQAVQIAAQSTTTNAVSAGSCSRRAFGISWQAPGQFLRTSRQCASRTPGRPANSLPRLSASIQLSRQFPDISYINRKCLCTRSGRRLLEVHLPLLFRRRATRLLASPCSSLVCVQSEKVRMQADVLRFEPYCTVRIEYEDSSSAQIVTKLILCRSITRFASTTRHTSFSGIRVLSCSMTYI